MTPFDTPQGDQELSAIVRPVAGVGRVETQRLLEYLGYMYEGVECAEEDAIRLYRFAAKRLSMARDHLDGTSEDSESLEGEIHQLADQADKAWLAIEEDNKAWAMAGQPNKHWLMEEEKKPPESDIARLYRLSKSSGHPEERNKLATMYAEGDDVNRNYREAVRLYRLAAEEGCVNALYNLGRMYEEERGVAWDIKEAVRLYRLAANGGDASAQYVLGLMHEKGHDEKEAARFYRLAADQKHKLAQYNLGRMYEEGRGVERNEGEAARLYRCAENSAEAWLHNLEALYTQTFL